MNKKVSIIIPVYNREKTIKRAIMSVVNQTYSNIELIVVDDGSKDKSLKIINELSKKHKNIFVISKKNTGVSDSRNVGLNKSTGDYVMFLDSDDEYSLDMVEEMVKNFEKNELKVCCYSNIEINGKKRTCNDIEVFNSKKINYAIEKLHNKGLFSIVWNKIYDLSIIKDNNIYFDTSLDFGEDFIFNVSYCKYIKNINLINKDLYLNYNSANGLARKFRINRFELVKKHFLTIKDMYNKNGYSLQYFYTSFVNDVRYSINDLFNLISNRSQLMEYISKIVNDNEVCEMLRHLKNKTWYSKLLEKKYIKLIYIVHKINFKMKNR